MRRPAFYRPLGGPPSERRRAMPSELTACLEPSELPAQAEAEFLAVEGVDRISRRGRLADERPVRRERIAPEEAVLTRFRSVDWRGVEIAAARHGHAQAVVTAEVVGPLHALAFTEAGGVAPVVSRAEPVAVGAQPSACERRIEARFTARGHLDSVLAEGHSGHHDRYRGGAEQSERSDVQHGNPRAANLPNGAPACRGN